LHFFTLTQVFSLKIFDPQGNCALIGSKAKKEKLSKKRVKELKKKLGLE
jgi:C4-type Zn-finger protein